jgi:acyl-CoA synthetase (AMP-forming)/AMP-acid ligase II
MKEQPQALCDSYRAEGLWTDRLLTDFLESAVERSPDKIAIVDERFAPITYAELAKEVFRLSAALQAEGIGRGDRFVIALPNWQHVTIFMLALGYLGAVSVHMPIAGREHEFSGVLRVSKAKGIVVAGEFRGHNFVDMIDGMAGDFPALKTWISVGSDHDAAGWIRYDRLLADAPADKPVPVEPVAASDLMFLLFTSGSSGDPKGVIHSSNTLTALNSSVAPLYDLGPDDVIFTAAPLGFSGGLAHGVRLAIFLGSTVVLLESWDTERALKLMVKEKAAFTILIPTLLRDLLNCPAFPDYADRLSLRVILCGGAYVSEDLLRLAREKLPSTLTTVIWGMTEGIGTGCRPDTPKEKLVTTDGRPFLGTQLKIIRQDDSKAATGEQGTIVMRGPQRFLGYLDRPELDEELFLEGGWFRTGDIGSIDQDGYLKITGREKEIIIRGGANISVAEIEAKLVGDPRINQLAIVDVPDERLGERLCACVVPKNANKRLTLDDITEIASEQGLAKYKWPEYLEIMDALPLSPAGKIKRPALKEIVLDRMASMDTAHG